MGDAGFDGSVEWGSAAEQRLVALLARVHRLEQRRLFAGVVLVAGGLVGGVAAYPLAGWALDPIPRPPAANQVISADDMTQNFEHVVAGITAVEERLGPALRYTSSSGQVIDGSFTVVDFSDATFDASDAVQTGPGWHFTAPSAGVYRVSARVGFTNASYSALFANSLDLYVEGVRVSTLGSQVMPAANSNYAVGLSGTDLVELDAGERIDVRTYSATGAALALSPDPLGNYITIERVD